MQFIKNKLVNKHVLIFNFSGSRDVYSKQLLFTFTNKLTNILKIFCLMLVRMRKIGKRVAVPVFKVHLKITLSIHRMYLRHIYCKGNGHKVSSQFHLSDCLFRVSFPLPHGTQSLEEGTLTYMNNYVVGQRIMEGQRRGMPPRILDVIVGLHICVN